MASETFQESSASHKCRCYLRNQYLEKSESPKKSKIERMPAQARVEKINQHIYSGLLDFKRRPAIARYAPSFFHALGCC